MARRIGVDVGGTNTDAALVDGRTVVAAAKVPTTDDVLSGIASALAQVPGDDVSAVVIGTTHFTNAVVQRRHLNRVGFLRIGLPAGRTLPPLVGWPIDLADRVRGETAMVTGGVEYDGRPFESLDEAAVIEAARRFADAGLEAIVVAGSFSPVDAGQEDRAAELLAEHIPNARITASHRLGRLGLLERENAAGLNACLLELARSTIAAFAAALNDAGFGPETRLFLTQNDGTLLSLEAAARYPVLTFASGPTNSMRGAALLGGIDDGLVVDVGGTTADFGALVGGYPRQANAAVDVGGVRTLFQLPDLLSVGLGGGSRIHRDRAGTITLGPDSVGQHLLSEALCFGGATATLTDAAVAAGRLTIDGASGPDRAALAGGLAGLAGLDGDEGADPEAVLAVAARTIADGADRLKLTAADVPLIAVGGGAFAVPDQLAGIGEVVRPPNGDTANAVGAALAEVSGEVDQVFKGVGRGAALATAQELATARA
ncbi:MAG: hydantoinase/oxoprolinase N-terminal domain-containing protein, partial [Acidimicrobiales bacterium]